MQYVRTHPAKATGKFPPNYLGMTGLAVLRRMF